MSYFKHGEGGTPLCRAWRNMRHRCSCPTHKQWQRYGGRGITVCREWEDYIVFRDWARSNGYAPGLLLDRRNNDLSYTPRNCRWVTSRVSCNNRGNNHKLKAWGETKTISEWIRDQRCKVDKQRIRKRLLLGWSVIAAISQPPRPKLGANR